MTNRVIQYFFFLLKDQGERKANEKERLTQKHNERKCDAFNWMNMNLNACYVGGGVKEIKNNG